MIGREIGDWLTASRVERMPLLIRAIRSHPPPGIAIEQASRVLWPLCGGPRDEVDQMVTILIRSGLVVNTAGRLKLGKEGYRVATQDHQAGGTMLARSLIDAGFFVQQARRLSELWTVESRTGDFTCHRKLAVSTAPQLVGLLRRFPGVTVQNVLLVPANIASILEDVWVLPTLSEDSRKTVGARGEYYSYRYEQSKASDATRIHWVSQDDDSLGYDIEDLNVEPRRRIEVKASGGSDLRFILSSHEWEVAHREPLIYEVQYWGTVNTSKSLRDEFAALVAAGYPIIMRNVAALIAAGDLSAEPVGYLVTKSVVV
jgi:hypothetical protein